MRYRTNDLVGTGVRRTSRRPPTSRLVDRPSKVNHSPFMPATASATFSSSEPAYSSRVKAAPLRAASSVLFDWLKLCEAERPIFDHCLLRLAGVMARVRCQCTPNLVKK